MLVVLVVCRIFSTGNTLKQTCLDQVEGGVDVNLYFVFYVDVMVAYHDEIQDSPLFQCSWCAGTGKKRTRL